MKRKRNSLLTVFAVVATLSLHAWEDHPDREDHKDSDRVFRDAQNQTSVQEYENSQNRESVSPEKDSNDGSSNRDISYNDDKFGVPDRDK